MANTDSEQGFPIAAADVGKRIGGGKTQILLASTADPYVAYVQGRDVVTWKNTEAMPMEGKGVWSTRVTCNLFEILHRAGIPTAYRGRVDERTFKADLCDMFPFEVVVVGIIDPESSYLKRNPHLKPETVLPESVVQMHLKTSGQTYNGRALPCDDPLMVIKEGESVSIYLPHKPIEQQEPIFSLSWEDALQEFPGLEQLEMIQYWARQAFREMRQRYEHESVGGKLYDCKFKFGHLRRPTPHAVRMLVLADRVDPDSMRLTVNGERADKQPIRNGGRAAAEEQRAAYMLAVRTSDFLMHV